MESSKKVQRKISAFGERIIKVLKLNGLEKVNGEVNYAEAERLCKIKGTTLSKAVYANGMHDDNLGKFLRTFRIEKEWLLHGRGTMESSEPAAKHTHDDNPPTISPKDLGADPGEVYRTIVEGRTSYLLVHESFLEKHEKQLDKKDKQIDDLHEIIKMMASGSPVPVPQVKKA